MVDSVGTDDDRRKRNLSDLKTNRSQSRGHRFVVPVDVVSDGNVNEETGQNEDGEKPNESSQLCQAGLKSVVQSGYCGVEGQVVKNFLDFLSGFLCVSSHLFKPRSYPSDEFGNTAIIYRLSFYEKSFV